MNNAWGGGTSSASSTRPTRRCCTACALGYLATFWMMQAAFPHMKRRAAARIVTLCSLNGVNAHMYTAEYNGAKEAARALTRTAAREWARHGIRANVICPAAATEAYEAFRRDGAGERRRRCSQQNPMGRMGDPEEDIGGVALFLASRRLPLLHGQHALRRRRLAHQRRAVASRVA